MSWTDERVELLKKLWTDGLSASQIAAKLGGGVSRNAVIGKVHRLKLQGRVKTTKSPQSKAKRPAATTARPQSGGYSGAASGVTSTGTRVNAFGGAQRSAPSTTHAVGATALKQDQEMVAFGELDQRPLEDVVVPIARKLKLVELSDQTCKWPFGDPLQGEFYFCGHNTDDKSPYCKYHGKLAFQQPQDRRKVSKG